MSSRRYDTSVEEEREDGLADASRAVQRGRLVILPTDTVYGVGADAFDPEAVQRLLEAKGRGRQMPPPVLVSAKSTVEALAIGIPEWASALVEELWPGSLTWSSGSSPACSGTSARRAGPSRCGCRTTRWRSSSWPAPAR